MRANIFQNVEPQTVDIEATPQRTEPQRNAPHDTVSDLEWSGEEDMDVSEPAEDRKSTRLNSSHPSRSRMPSSA